jgi:hypothetical protein
VLGDDGETRIGIKLGGFASGDVGEIELSLGFFRAEEATNL